MKPFIILLGVFLVAGCAGESGSNNKAQTPDPNLQKLECDRYLFFINRDGVSSKDDILAFFDSLYKSTGFTNISVGPTNFDLNGSIMVTANAHAGRANERSQGLVKISALKGVAGSCDVVLGPAQ